jgi:ATP-dependent exoDNAse (exonuclease V) alpha subunit
VVVIADEAAGSVACRELVYTAISRAKDICVIIGKRSVIDRQSAKVSLGKRKTFLRELLTKE